MELSLKICGVCLLALIASLMLKDRHRSAAVLCTLSALCTVLMLCFRGALSEVVGAVEGIYEGTYFENYAVTLFKALGIAYITSISSELCKSAGEGTLAYAVGIGGKIELILLCVPMVYELLKLAGSSLGVG